MEDTSEWSRKNYWTINTMTENKLIAIDKKYTALGVITNFSMLSLVILILVRVIFKTYLELFINDGYTVYRLSESLGG